jgi:hypothetical protein
MSNVQYISFENGAPRLALPADYTTEQIQTYLKSDKFQQQMANNGYAYMYGLTPVNLRDPECMMHLVQKKNKPKQLN